MSKSMASFLRDEAVGGKWFLESTCNNQCEAERQQTLSSTCGLGQEPTPSMCRAPDKPANSLTQRTRGVNGEL